LSCRADGSLGTIGAQQKFQGLTDYAVELQLVDFAKVAEAVGLNGIVVDSPEAFGDALDGAMTSDTATVIDARIDPEPFRDSFMATTGIMP
jgi:pyruvate dehydrogenase (quinone)